jgi:electron transport complex protein RnfE
MLLVTLTQEKDMNKESISNLTRGIIRENPIFVMLLGMCPTLGVSTSAINGLGMGMATMFVLMLSNMAISSVKKIIPDIIRIPSFIVIIASFVTILEMLMQAYLPMLYGALGIYIPLIVVNCIILGRAEAFASKNTIWQSLLDAIGMGIGFTMALTILGAIREILGNGSIFGWSFISETGNPILLFIMPPGAFLALAGIIVVVNKLRGAK